MGKKIKSIKSFEIVILHFFFFFNIKLIIRERNILNEDKHIIFEIYFRDKNIFDKRVLFYFYFSQVGYINFFLILF
jgi:hypothetical protein